MTSPITETDIAALDRAAARTWRGTEEEPLGHWLLRAGGGFGARGVLVPVADHLRGSRTGHRVGGEVLRVAAVVDVRIDERERNLGHAGGLAVARAGEDDIFHLDAAQAFGRLLAQYPGDRVGNIGLSAAIGADNGGDAFPGKLHLGAVAEGFEPEDLNFLELEQRCGDLAEMGRGANHR